jgi:hypothetical protein
MKKKFYLFMTIFMIVIGTSAFVSGLYALEPTRINFTVIMFVWMISAMGSYMYYELYKEHNEKD